MGDTAAKLDMELDDIVGGSGGRVRGGGGPVRRGGRPPKGGGVAKDGRDSPYRNTGGRTHLKGVSVQDIASAPESDRWVHEKSQLGSSRAISVLAH